MPKTKQRYVKRRNHLATNDFHEVDHPSTLMKMITSRKMIYLQGSFEIASWIGLQNLGARLKDIMDKLELVFI